MQRSDITVAALALVGSPFHAQGRLPGVGLDCIGVLACVAKACGLPFDDQTSYPLRPTGALRPALDAQYARVDGEPKEGDILLMSFGGEPHHIAIMVGGDRIVHAYMTVRKCVVQGYTDHWRAKVRAVYQFPGVE